VKILAREEPNALLMLSRRNEVFQVLVGCGLSAFLSEFRWREVRQSVNSQERGVFGQRVVFVDDREHNRLVSRLDYKHEKQTYFFLFAGSGSPMDIVYFPDANLGEAVLENIPWPAVIHHVRSWGEAIARELTPRDLWSEIEIEGERLIRRVALDVGDSRPFSPAESELIWDATRIFQQTLLDRYEISPEMADEIKSRLDQLASVSQQQSRTAWLHTTVGVIVSIALAVTPQAEGVVATLLTLFGQLLASRQVLRFPEER
jgi:hypothetical protein